MLHITGAFLLVGGSVAAGIFNTFAVRAERPSDAAFMLRMVRPTLPLIGIGSVAALVFGLWLVHEQSTVKLFSFWIIAALVLWVVMGALGSAGGKHQERTRAVAERLAAAGDTSDDELALPAARPARQRDVVAGRARGAAPADRHDLEAGPVIAAGRPFLPLFLHVLGAMVLVGAMLSVLFLTVAAWRKPLALLSKSTFRTLLDRRHPGLGRDACRRPVDVLRGRLERRQRPDLARHRLHGRRHRPARAPAHHGLRLLVVPFEETGRRPYRRRALRSFISCCSASRGSRCPASGRSPRDGLTKALPQQGEFPRKRGIGSAQ